MIIISLLGGQPADTGRIRKVDGDETIEFNVSAHAICGLNWLYLYIPQDTYFFRTHASTADRCCNGATPCIN